MAVLAGARGSAHLQLFNTPAPEKQPESLCDSQVRIYSFYAKGNN